MAVELLPLLVLTVKLTLIFRLMQVGLNSILFDQSLLHKYNIIEVGSDSKP